MKICYSHLQVEARAFKYIMHSGKKTVILISKKLCKIAALEVPNIKIYAWQICQMWQTCLIPNP